MLTTQAYRGGENFDLGKMMLKGRALKLRERVEFFGSFLEELTRTREQLCLRQMLSPAGRQVQIHDPYTGTVKDMLMFGSNNYLGLARHPHVKEMVTKAAADFGVGIGGPPLLNGYTRLHRELEERLAALKGTEDCLLFSSGYGANVGLLSGLLQPHDTVYYDGYSHASFCDGLKLAGASAMHFPHNDLKRLQLLLSRHPADPAGDVYVGVEGVYSMDGDIAPLDKLVPLCRAHGAMVVLDDAHGTGVMGRTGRGTAEHFGLEGQIDITVGTLSKTFAVTGGFVASSRAIVDYLRYLARSYMFSASLPPIVVAAALAGLDVMEREPERLSRLHENIAMAACGFRRLGFSVAAQSPIIPLRVPMEMNIRRAGYRLHEMGIFVNSIEYPAVPTSQQRFRVSIIADHTKADIQRLLDAVEVVWSECAAENLDAA